MTTVAVLADPPREGLVFPALVEATPLSTADAARLYTAALSDVLRAAEASGGELLVNYHPEESLPEPHRRSGDTDADDSGRDGGGSTDENMSEGENGDLTAEAEVRTVAHAALSTPEEARYEVQVGETFAGRAGNTATHLLAQEGVESVAIVPGSAAFLDRTGIDSAAMKLRGSEVVLGPGLGGAVYYAGFTEPIDLADAYAPPEVETLTDRALAADLEIDFLPMSPTLDTPAGLLNAVTLCRARERAGRIVPAHTAACIADLGLAVEEHDGDRRLVRE